MNFNLLKSSLFLYTFILFNSNCTNPPAINYKYDFNSAKSIKIDKISDYLNFPGSGEIMEDNLSLYLCETETETDMGRDRDRAETETETETETDTDR